MRTVCGGLNLAGATVQGRSGLSPEALAEQRVCGRLSVRTAEGVTQAEMSGTGAPLVRACRGRAACPRLCCGKGVQLPARAVRGFHCRSSGSGVSPAANLRRCCGSQAGQGWLAAAGWAGARTAACGPARCVPACARWYQLRLQQLPAQPGRAQPPAAGPAAAPTSESVLLSFQDTVSQKSVDIHDSVQPRSAEGRPYQPGAGATVGEEMSKTRPTASASSVAVWHFVPVERGVERGGVSVETPREESDTGYFFPVM